MNILILCDRKSTDDRINTLSVLQNILVESGHEVNTNILNREEILPCIGCFGCWIKTPGVCALTKDCANSIASQLVNSDAVILLSEVTFGGFSADVKAFLDRLIQNILPLFKMHKGEMHHPKRYDNFPAWLAIGYGDVSDDEKQTFIHLADRNALNMRPRHYLSLVTRNCDELEAKTAEIIRVLEVSA